MDIIAELNEVIRARLEADPDDSYVASLQAKGRDAILKKVGEEATEVVLAAKDAEIGVKDPALIGEVADLWFHTLVLLAHLDHDPEWVFDELRRRFGVSGHVEKANR